MNFSKTTRTLPAPVILEATSGSSGFKEIKVDMLESSGATLEIPGTAVKPGDRIQAWSNLNGVTIVNEIKTVGPNGDLLTFKVPKEKLNKGEHPDFLYVLLNDKDEAVAVSTSDPYLIV